MKTSFLHRSLPLRKPGFSLPQQARSPRTQRAATTSRQDHLLSQQGHPPSKQGHTQGTLRSTASQQGHPATPSQQGHPKGTLRSALALTFLLATMAAHAQVAVNGTVHDPNGTPVAFASVLLGEQGMALGTDAQGAFRAKGFFPGDLRIRISAVGFAALDTIVAMADGGNTYQFTLHPGMQMLAPAEVTALRAGERAPFAKSVVTAEEIQRTNTGVDLPYLLDMQPSVVSTSDGGTGIGYTAMRIRGSDATRTNITLNGVPFNDAESQGAFLVNLPDLATSAEDIEVQRGVGTSTNGPGAFGASVNLRTTTVKKDPWGLVSAGAGSFNTQRYSVSAGTGLIQDRFSLDMRLSSITSDGYIDRATADLKSYFLQGAWIGEKRSFRFITFRGKENTYQAWDGVPREVLDTNRTYNSFTYDNQVDNYDQTHYQLHFDQKVGSNATLNLTLFRVLGAGYYEQWRPNDKLTTYGIASPVVIDGDTLKRTDIIRRRWLQNTLTGANLSADIKLGRHALVVGGSYSDYAGGHFGEVIWARYAGSLNIRDRYYNNDARKTDANAFAKLTYAIGADIDLYGDAQVRHVGYTFLGVNNDLRDITQQLEWTFFNPKAGVLWRMAPGSKAYASFAVANREPNRKDLTEGTPLEWPRSERLLDYELGYEYRTGRWNAGINLYYMDYQDQLVLTGELTDTGGDLRTNMPKSYRAGIELMGAAQLAKPLVWKANATFSQNRLGPFAAYVDDWDNGGQVAFPNGASDLAYSPSVVAASEINLRLWQKQGRGNAHLAFITKYVGSQYLDNTSNPDRMLDAYVVNDLRANVQLVGLKGLQRIDFNLTVRNVFSELYESNGWVYSYISESRRMDQVNLFPQAPINVLGGVSVRF